MSDRVELSRTYPVPVEKLFEMCASPAFFARVGAEPSRGFMDLRQGGAYEYGFENGARVWGEFREVAPGRRLVMTWSSDNACGPCEGTLVTMDFAPDGLGARLTLVHDGFRDPKVGASHGEGWTEIFGEITADLEGKLGAALKAGLTLEFEMTQTFAAPVSEAYEAFVRADRITSFFVTETTGDLVPGRRVKWRFSKCDKEFHIFCQEAEKDRLLRFRWGQAQVRFDFEALPDARSRVKVTCGGWPPTQEGLDSSYAECEGWREVLGSWQEVLEKGR